MPTENKELIKKHRRTFYLKHTEQVKTEILIRKQKIRTWFREFKKTLCCKNCPENHPSCLDFHHRNPKTKLFEVSYGYNMGYSIETILKEIKKCDVLCSNCHRKIHYKGD